ncbi:hypothetical protein Tco_0276675 [Tanacetum coccineum]
MDANKRYDLLNPQCPNESKILANIILNHPLRLSIAGFFSAMDLHILILAYFSRRRVKASVQVYFGFTKIIIDYYMNEHPDIPKRLHDNYHRVENDDHVKTVFNSRKNKDGAGMKIPD